MGHHDWHRVTTHLVEILRSMSSSDEVPSAERTPSFLIDCVRRLAGEGLFGWLLDPICTAEQQCRLWIELAAIDLPIAFTVTQMAGAVKRMARSDEKELDQTIIGDLLSGRRTASVGISQLTTSRQHLGQPAMASFRQGDHWVIDGVAPWITAATVVDGFVVGAVCDDDCQMLVYVDREQSGVEVQPPGSLLAMNETGTTSVRLANVIVRPDRIVEGPSKTAKGGGAAGGLTTSALAIGLATGSLRNLTAMAQRRPSLSATSVRLQRRLDELRDRLLAAAAGGEEDPLAIRSSANDLVMQVTQSEMVAAKGAGYSADHPAAVHCGQSLFFLVWSCPPAVSESHLRRFGGDCE